MVFVDEFEDCFRFPASVLLCTVLYMFRSNPARSVLGLNDNLPRPYKFAAAFKYHGRGQGKYFDWPPSQTRVAGGVLGR
jgi:hypothetical protein